MEIKYSSHAVERMLQRRISLQEVEDILTEPDDVSRQSRDKFIAYEKIRGRRDNLLAAVAVEDGRVWEVITVMVNFEVRK